MRNQVAAAADPDAKVPAAALAASKRADEIHKAAYPAPEAAPTEGEAKPVEGEAKPTEGAPVPVTPESNVEAAPPAPPAPPAPAENFEHKYNSMKGRHDRLVAQQQELVARLNELQEALAAKTTPPDQATPAELRAESLITPEERESFGDELLGVVARTAKETLNPEVIELRKTVDELKAKVEGSTKKIAESAQSKMYEDLSVACPNWQEINISDAFHAWLALPDTYSGAIRHELLKAAHDQNDSRRVLAFFNGFLSEEAVVDPAVQVEPAKVEGAPAPTKVPLTEFAAPGRAKSAAGTPPPAEKPVFTRAQVTQFYADSAAGKYRGREAEKSALEMQIHAAGKDGRIQ